MDTLRLEVKRVQGLPLKTTQERIEAKKNLNRNTVRTYQGKILHEREKNSHTLKITYSMAQESLKSFDRPLMMVYLSNSIIFTLISTRGRVMGDKSIASSAN